MRVMVLGGDGFCGWPTSLHLSEGGHDVLIADNLSRRTIDVDMEVESLTPIQPLGERLRAWKEHSGRTIEFVNLDLTSDFDLLCAVLGEYRPDAVVHLAEQRAAPYSMRSPATKRYTVDNNLTGTHNLLCALVATGVDAAVVHMGTLGSYGYGALDRGSVPAPYLRMLIETREGALEREALQPVDPPSLYHLTQAMDQLLFAFYARNDGLRITELNQGVVWGTQTAETGRDERLINRFDYDGDYGTVLNRFIMQAAIGHPLTVHGHGQQTRAFIHIRDTMRCIEAALLDPPAKGERPRIRNQLTETHKVGEIAWLISRLTGADVMQLPDPRREQTVDSRGSLASTLDFEPITLIEGLLEECTDVAGRYRDRVDPTKIMARSVWKTGTPTAPSLMLDRQSPAPDVEKVEVDFDQLARGGFLAG